MFISIRSRVLLGGLAISSIASAHDESIGFRLNAEGGVDAVVSGLLWGGSCSERAAIAGPSRVEVAGSVIRIISPTYLFADVCVPKPYDVKPYEVVAPLGRLPAATFEVSWFDDFGLRYRAALAAGAFLPPRPIPVFGLAGIVLASLLLAIAAAVTQRKWHSRAIDRHCESRSTGT